MDNFVKFDRFKFYLMENAELSEEDFALLVPYLSFRVVGKDTILLHKGETVSQIYFTLSGMLRSYSVDASGRQHIIQFAPENWWIGDRNSFFFDEPAENFIDSIEDSEVVVLQKSFYEVATRQFPSFNKFNFKALHNEGRFMQRRINGLLSAVAEERYLEFLKLYPKLSLRIPQLMIASYLGITPESLSRVRNELARKKFTF